MEKAIIEIIRQEIFTDKTTDVTVFSLVTGRFLNNSK